MYIYTYIYIYMHIYIYIAKRRPDRLSAESSVVMQKYCSSGVKSCQIMSNLNCRRQTYNLKQLKDFKRKQK